MPENSSSNSCPCGALPRAVCTSHDAPHLIFITTLLGQCHYYPQLTHGETEALGAGNSLRVPQGFDPRQCGSMPRPQQHPEKLSARRPLRCFLPQNPEAVGVPCWDRSGVIDFLVGFRSCKGTEAAESFSPAVRPGHRARPLVQLWWQVPAAVVWQQVSNWEEASEADLEAKRCVHRCLGSGTFRRACLKIGKKRNQEHRTALGSQRAPKTLLRDRVGDTPLGLNGSCQQASPALSTQPIFTGQLHRSERVPWPRSSSLLLPSCPWDPFQRFSKVFFGEQARSSRAVPRPPAAQH